MNLSKLLEILLQPTEKLREYLIREMDTHRMHNEKGRKKSTDIPPDVIDGISQKSRRTHANTEKDTSDEQKQALHVQDYGYDWLHKRVMPELGNKDVHVIRNDMTKDRRKQKDDNIDGRSVSVIISRDVPLSRVKNVSVIDIASLYARPNYVSVGDSKYVHAKRHDNTKDITEQLRNVILREDQNKRNPPSIATDPKLEHKYSKPEISINAWQSNVGKYNKPTSYVPEHDNIVQHREPQAFDTSLVGQSYSRWITPDRAPEQTININRDYNTLERRNEIKDVRHTPQDIIYELHKRMIKPIANLLTSKLQPSVRSTETNITPKIDMTVKALTYTVMYDRPKANVPDHKTFVRVNNVKSDFARADNNIVRSFIGYVNKADISPKGIVGSFMYKATGTQKGKSIPDGYIANTYIESNANKHSR